jgi:hypothetical protein
VISADTWLADIVVLAHNATTSEEVLFARLEERRDLHGEANTVQIENVESGGMW